jgi:hypothetical protein
MKCKTDAAHIIKGQRKMLREQLCIIGNSKIFRNGFPYPSLENTL